jgi:hypothetical protein
MEVFERKGAKKRRQFAAVNFQIFGVNMMAENTTSDAGVSVRKLRQLTQLS